ncbi:MAG: UDP-N-acetylmuramoyl-tripeptide--D-alanyl-D-alanine ligase [Magnetococcales bacterium]|nr:UDP-N-acetylmuramoyl-tripeptide--D-alanyl-D-alanine ligase [Magnetococcales bacterium]
MAFDLDFVCQTLHLTPQSNRPLRGLSIDTRTLQPEQIFAAIRGPRFDGHDYIPQAIQGGCGALLVETPPKSPPPCPVLVVADILKAMEQLATAWRNQVDPIVIAITGSSGKTTVKEMTNLCLQQHFKGVHATKGNLNNHYGVPLTLLAMPETCQALVVEMGMSAAGEIAQLTRMAQPDVGVVTNVLAAHLAAFTSIEEIAQAKGELFAEMPPQGVAIFNGTQWARALLQSLAGDRKQITFGPWDNRSVSLDLSARSIRQSAEGLAFHIHWPDHSSTPVHLPCQGRHMVDNALAAAAACRQVGVTTEAIVRGLKLFSPPAGRGAIQRAAGGWMVIDDSYNANPGSVKAAIQALAASPEGARRVVILGDMLELGKQAESLHRELAEEITKARVSHLFTAGPLMKHLHEACQNVSTLTAQHRDDPGDWLGTIPRQLQPGDRVLVKGSRGMKMERIVSDLISYAL